MRHAIAQRLISAAQAAEMALQAVEADRFHVLPQQNVKHLILERAQAAQLETTAFDPVPER